MKRKHFLLSFFVMMVTLLTFISGTSAHAEGKKYTIGTDLTFALLNSKTQRKIH